MIQNSKPAQPKWLNGITHFCTRDFLSNPYPSMGERVTILLSVPADAPVKQAILRTVPNGEQAFTRMEPTERKVQKTIYRAEMLVTEARMTYRFGVQTQKTVWWINALGASQYVPLELFDFKLLADTPEIPWLSKSVFYQIFPDRFANGDPGNDPQGEKIPYRNIIRKTFPWGQPQPYDAGVIPFYGGDLKGITDHLDYLCDLGVSAIYLNPVFTAYSNHRYDVIDYKHVDPTLGGDEALLTLSRALKDRNMRYVLDIVPNHSGYGHPWFQSASKDASSKEADFFFFDEDHKKYISWMGFGSLPKLNYASKVLREEMYEGESSVFRYWLKPPFLADGWRVDVANMLGRQNEQQIGPEVIAGIRQAVKETNPESYLFGENFYEASSQLQGKGWDGVMNYTGFCDPLLHWLRPFHTGALGWEGELCADDRWETESLVKTWQAHLASIPWTIALQQLNLLDSHDTSRVRTELGGNLKLLRLAAIVQFTFPGVPCVYYGDEIGLSNLPGFDSRACFPWNQDAWDLDLLAFYKRLIDLRKSNEVLTHGAFQMLYWDDSLIFFQRILGDRQILVTANRNPKTTKKLLIDLSDASVGEGKQFKGLFSKVIMLVNKYQVILPALPSGGEIWLEV